MYHLGSGGQDVTVLSQTELALALTVAEQNIVQSLSVQYRGIFLNDEDWGLQPVS
ncbi:hypothetical protein NDQ71_23860 (plasmid) [Pseudoalteromonas sp. KG3]|uniref:Uncharacterized protein n=1 Tax=Pseudoalteromonas prydzensis TaxID=182141 RepID=A0ABR9FS84_9GAMM|nr:hypothetical protein [Pseudoalteromonas sp. KG3]MBE0459664.1 hypothetical protein [Pseudoalteromonas prydzensis]WKD26466.1 hypothetical protein NDQ71_23860 [Pseudoalteromonas sp. KG3]